MPARSRGPNYAAGLRRRAAPQGIRETMTYLLYSPASTIILAVTLVFSILGLRNSRIIDRAILRPYWVFRKGEYERLITSGFVHADAMHLIFNMITFFFFAFPLERVIGSVQFFVLYLLALVLSDLGTCYKHRNDPNYASLGASGAVLGVLFASIVYFPNQSLFLFPIPVPIPAPLFAVGYLAYSYWASKQSVGRINHDAHIGGALVGLAFVAITEPRAYRQLLDYLA
jgi:membrane associated rhomboid family serine protease